MITSNILIVLILIFVSTTLAWRSQTSTGSTGIQIGERGGPKRIGGGDKERHKQDHHTKKEENSQQHFNIGLIVPHTNFGKREYQRAITSAVSSLQKMRDTKLPFLRDVDFTAKNVHFDMILLTPSPTSE